MFERYTEKARRTIFFARYEASSFGSSSIEPEHILLGLWREQPPIPNASLDGDELRKEVEAHLSPRKVSTSTSVDLPPAKAAVRILEYAAEEAEQLHHKHIGTEHLLVGVLREEDCFAAQLLRKHGVTLETVRQRLGAQAQIAPKPVLSIHRWRAPGTPDNYGFDRLLYNPASESLIVQMTQLHTSHAPISRLFVRHKDSNAYEQVGEPDVDISHIDPVTCAQEPLLFFLAVKMSPSGGGNIQGVYRFHLQTRKLELCVTSGSLNIPGPHLRAWVASLVSVSDHGESLYVRLAVERTHAPGTHVEHSLVRLRLPHLRIEDVSPLKDTFF